MMPKINKNIIIGISIAVVLVFSVIISVALFQKEKPLLEEEIIEEEKTSEQLLQDLTSIEQEPLTEEEKKEQEKLLEQLTPSQAKPMTEEEQKELEELLKQLTPQ